ncbi:Nonribosomal peptide synthetase [Metarhizium acridum]|nr:Nonribosomal peptide synthetase [Metarhizium acridum]
MEVVFNYHGQFQQLERDHSLFDSVALDNVSDVGPNLPASSLFNINMSIEGGQTHVSFAWNRHISNQGLIREWIDQIGPSLEAICKSLRNRSSERTLVDYEFLSLDYTTLDGLQSRIIPEIESLNGTVVEDIYPCSPMVEGILLSQLKDVGFYETSQLYEIRTRGSHVINMRQLSTAWKDVIARHPSLRSVFIESLDSSMAFNQVVLKEIHGDVVLLESGNLDSARALMQKLPKVKYHKLKPPHRVSLCQVQDTNSILCQIEMSHTITDGASTGILIEDWAKAYKGVLGKDNLIETSRGFARALTSSISESKRSYWKKKLADLQPCLFPHLDKISEPSEVVSWSVVEINGADFAAIQKFCETHSITPASLFHAAWALTLASYTGTHSVCFGYIASGRDLPVPDIGEAIGAYANMMVCRADISPEWNKKRFVQYLHHQVLEDMGYQHCSLADIQHDLGIISGQQLFNTIMSFQKDVDDLQDGHISQELDFIDEDGDDPTEYDVAISITVGAKLAKLFINCLPSRFSNEQAHRIVSLFKTAVTRLIRDDIPQSYESTLRSIDLISKDDLKDIWQWNSIVPEAADSCLHDLIRTRAQRQPEAYAVNAWDGDWTYGQLEHNATQLAYHLAGLGVGPDVIVAIYVEKSRWAPVAMLAVMKLGGASIMMDSSQSENILRAIMEQSKPMLLLSSSSIAPLAAKLTERPILVVNDDLLETLATATAVSLPVVQSSSMACLILSSASTGPSKVAILTHANLCSAVKYQQDALGYKPDTRVYDFMPYSFHITWEIFAHVFTIGGCLCVPSESEHKGVLADSISRWQPTIINITPAAAAMLSDSTVQSLETLILCGERLSTDMARRWAPLVDLRFTYGCCECTPIATVGIVRPEDADEPRIGRGVGVNTWITDARDGTSLVPIGSIGELVLEGPLVGAGYLGDAETTTAALIHNPPWLNRGSGDPKYPGRTGRLFRTGDLVRYDKDGSLTFIARKEAQVKIHGQHVELEDIENHMVRLPSIRRAACLVPKSGPFAGKLAGVFSLDGVYEDDSDADNTVLHLVTRDRAEEVQDNISSLQALLDNSVPVYMVPDVWVALKNIPVDHSGKLDRKLVENWLSSLDAEMSARISNAVSSASSPITTTERVIQDACSHILNIPANHINMQRSFIANGGDSISAMRVSPYCRASGILVSVASLLRSKKLVDVAESATVAKGPSLSREEDFDKPFSLSPIQQWFFAQSPPDKVNTTRYYCNQAFYVQIKRPVSPDHVSLAIRKIVQEHSMLRARFHLDKTKGSWTQLIPKPRDALYHFAPLQADTLPAVQSVISQRHQELDIERGLVFAVDMFTLPSGEQYLALIAHHLVVDLVSWRIILEDLESLLNGGTVLEELPFQVWHSLQKQEAQSPNFAPERVLSSEVHNELDFWNYTPTTPNTFDDHIEETFEVDCATTAILLKEANRAFNTEPVDIILASVWDAFFNIFKMRNGLTIFNEGHGREPWGAEIDLSRTVGWFTTMTPMHVSRDHTRYNSARVVKDMRRQLPSNGWAYFTSRYLNDEGIKAFESHDCVMEVLFNYHGQFQQLESDDSLFENVAFDIFDVGSDLPTSALFSINASIEGGLTKFTFSWNRHISHQDLIRDWIAQVAPSMQALCSSLLACEPSLTIADYEFLNLDYKGLDELQNRILPALQSETGTAITDIYPCSPMVDGMLLSQIKDPEAYKTLLTYEMKHHNSLQQLNIDVLANAWQAVVARHPALRSVFIEGVDNKTAFVQAVLETYQGEVIICEAENRTAAVTTIRKLAPVDYQRLKPAHRLALCTARDVNTIICQIEMSHTIVDGASTAIMLNDWSRAYSGILGTENLGETNRNFVRALKSSPLANTMAYWKKKLAGLEPCHFPTLSDASSPGNSIAVVSTNLGGDDFARIQRFCESESVTPASIFQSAWALLLSTYTSNDSVCFGYIASGRDLPIDGIAESVNAYANMMICRADVSRHWTPRQFVKRLHDQVLEDLDFQHCSLADIQHDLRLSPGYPLFNTIVSFQKDDADAADDVAVGDLIFIDMDHEDPTEYDISFDISYGKCQVAFSLDYRLSCLTNEQAERVISLLSAITISIVSEKRASATLAAIDMVSQGDLEQIWKWNSVVPEKVEALVHDLISETARKFPNDPAICAWDGDWTYQQLDTLSTNLAYKLVKLGVGPEHMVPLCFEKTRWTPIAMLAVMKAGGSSLALDTALPEERLRIIMQQVKPTIILTSSTSQDLVSRLTTGLVFTVDEANVFPLEPPPNPAMILSDVTPSNTLYVVFTSGSTGTPKGVTINHANFASSLRHQHGAHNFKAGARVYDFASYTFDTSWQNVLSTLECGACLCIPSNSERQNDLAGSLERFQVSHAEMTPSAAQLLPASAIKRLDTLILGGEVLSPELAKYWASMTNVKNSYGPCECTPTTTVATIDPDNVEVPSIGRGYGVNTWVVSTTGDSLAPVGSTGELFLEGPLVGPGYLDDAERTAASFIENPSWLLRGSATHPGRQGRLYRTGDLVRYQPNGSLTFIGRKDSQVKINGQRLELGDIEYYIRSNITYEGDVRVVVDVVKPQDSERRALVAFLGVEESSADLDKIIAGLADRLAAQVPAYMIPSAYMLLESIPMTPSGKTDRRKLRTMAEKLTRVELMAHGPTQATRRAPTTPKEIQLQGLWSTVLGIPREMISSEDSFLRIGGDSIGAMKLAGLARDAGLSITVTDIFRHPCLSDLAKTIRNSFGNENEAVLPFSLLSSKLDALEWRAQIAQLCDVSASLVEDAFPCTPLQEGLLALTLRRSGDYVAQNIFELKRDISISRFQRAWEHVIATTPILRTRIVDLHTQGLVQVVVAEEPTMWPEPTSTILYQEADKKLGMGLGTPLMRYAITKDSHDRHCFIWTVHHALYDGWSMPLVLERLEMAYNGTVLQPPPPFQDFVKFIGGVDDGGAEGFWASQFDQIQAQAFPSLPSPVYQPRSDAGISHRIKDLVWPKTDTTASTAIRAALSILIAVPSDSSDSLFGATVTGRQAPVPGIENMTGPTIATVPIRVAVDRESTVSQLLHQVQAQVIDMTAFEQTGLQRIRRVNASAKQACNFQTLLLIHPIEEAGKSTSFLFNDAEDEGDGDGDEIVDDSFAGFDTHAITIECDLESNGALLRFRFDSQVIKKPEVEKLAARFDLILRQLCDPDMAQVKITDIDTVSSGELKEIWDWNSLVPETINHAVHDLIAENASKYPDSPAVCAWDGNWTYHQLDSISTRIAHRLNSLGIGPDVIVPICFEKSRWMPIAMLAVMKAGGASVALDTTLPPERLRSILQQVSPSLVLASSLGQSLAKGLTDQPILVLGEGSQGEFDEIALQTLPKVEPWNKLYLVFTSGSTGVPKGAIVTHSNFSSAIHHQQAITGFSRSSRVYDLAKYAFDISWSNFIHTMAAGGCLCIPSQQEALDDITGSILAYNANFIDITPSVASTLRPSDLRCLKTVVFAGEALTNHQASQWSKHARVLNMYGPAECTVKATLAELDGTASSSAASIGRGVGLCTWVVDPSNHNKLSPVGTIGELVLEGPIVGSGYLGDAAKTAGSFIESPAWLLRGGPGHQGRRGRVYKTGDLVQYNVDGSLTFIGRKDGQVKINGQRLELGDVEHNLASSLSAMSKVQLAAEVITPRDSDNAMLAAFIQSSGQIGDFESAMRTLTAGLNDRLASKVPGYMIPSAYIMVDKLPLSATGKLDRKQLRAMGGKLTLLELMSSTGPQPERRPPSAPMELCLQKLWAYVLGLNAEEISADDSFLHLGGDSIQAMKLAQRARSQGFHLAVADILMSPKLSQMASCLKDLNGESVAHALEYRRFSLLPPESRPEIEQILIEHGISTDNVQDIIPVTDQQARYLLTTYTTARSAVYYHTLDHDGDYDLGQMQHACASLIRRLDMMRTVFIAYKDSFLQAVLANLDLDIGVFETATSGLDEYTLGLKKQDLLCDLQFGQPLTKISVIRQTQEQKYRIVIRLSHAQYDGTALAKMWAAFEDAYKSAPPGDAKTSFSHYMHTLSLLDKQKATEYWRKMLQGSTRTAIKHQTTHRLGYGLGPNIVKTIPASSLQSEEFTFATVLKAAWSYVLARYSATEDVVFGSLIHGRNQPGTQDVFGPCVNIVPARIVFQEDWSARDLISTVNSQQAASIPFETMGSRDIIHNCTSWPKWAFFSSVITHQNYEDRQTEESLVDFDSADLSTGDIDSVEVYITSTPGADSTEIDLTFTDNVISHALAQQLASDLADTIIQFHKAMDTKLIAPREIRNLPALLPLPADSNVILSPPTDEQMTALNSCPAKLKNALSRAWKDVLGLQTVPSDESTETFFELGGDANNAGQLAAHMQRQGYKLRIEDVFEHPTWSELLLHVGRL